MVHLTCFQAKARGSRLVTSALGEERFLPSGDEAGTPPGNRNVRPDIEVFRALAILPAVLFCCGLGPAQGGFVGVDVYFVISGYVMISGILLRERATTGSTGFTTFYFRRSRRTRPAALLVIAVTVVATSVIDRSHGAVLNTSDERWSAVFLGNVHFTSAIRDIIMSRDLRLRRSSGRSPPKSKFISPTQRCLRSSYSPCRHLSARLRLTLALVAVAAASFVVSATSSHPGNAGFF